MRATELHKMKASLRPGAVYRRQDLAHLSSNVDRHLAALLKEGVLRRLNQGLYSCPEKTAFGDAPPDERALLRAFLRDDNFVVYSPNAFNSLGLGTTQLYNVRLVFNRKRHGDFLLGGRTYRFFRWREAPRQLTQEFLVVELVNRLDELVEDRDELLAALKKHLPRFDSRKLLYAARHYGTYSTQLKLGRLLEGLPRAR